MIEQIAIACKNPEQLKRSLNFILGADDWHQDFVCAEGNVFPRKGNEEIYENKAELNFNYDLGPFEFELIKYEDGANWLENINTNEENFLSHLGFHIDDPDRFEKVYKNLNATLQIAQEVYTKSHTNEAIKDERRYRYVIFDTRDLIGFDLKIIQRLNLDGTPYVKSVSERLYEIKNKLSSMEKEMIELEKEEEHLEKKAACH